MSSFAITVPADTWLFPSSSAIGVASYNLLNSLSPRVTAICPPNKRRKN
jgi:hypothetical protein